MNRGNPWLHSSTHPDVFGTNVTYLQIPQNVNTPYHPVQIQQPLYNSAPSVLSKRLNPYEVPNPLEKRLKLVDGGFLVEVAPQNSFPHQNNLANIHQMGGFLHQSHCGRENGTISQPIIVGDFSSFKPSLPMAPIDLKQLENSVLGNFIAPLAPQVLPTYETLSFNGLAQQFPIEGNQLILQNQQTGFLNIMQQPSIQVVAAPSILNLQPQPHMLADHNNLFSGNLLSSYQQHQQQNLLNLNQAPSHFNLQQIQISSLNLQPMILPPLHNSSILQQQQQQNDNSVFLSSYESMMMKKESQKAERISPNKSEISSGYQSMRDSQPRFVDIEVRKDQAKDQELRKSPEKKSFLPVSKSITPKLTEALANLENDKKISPRKEDDLKVETVVDNEKPSKESASTAGSSEQAEIDEEPKSTESFSDSLVTINSKNREKRRKSIADMISQRNREEKTTKSFKELKKILKSQTKEELEFFARRKKNSERRKNRWQIAQDTQIEEQQRQIIEIEAENTEQKIVLTCVGPLNQVELPPFFEEDARPKIREIQFRWNPEVIEGEEFETLVAKVGEILKKENVDHEKLIKLLKQNDYDTKKTLEMIQLNLKWCIQFFSLRQKKLKMRPY